MRLRPFSNRDTSGTFRALVDQIKKEIDALDNEYVLKASPTELEQYYVAKVTVSLLSLDAANYYIDRQQGIQLDVSHHFDRVAFPGEQIKVQGTQIDIAIPYTGDKELWQIRPSSFILSGYPELDIRDDVVVFSCQFPDDTANSDRIKAEIEDKVHLLADAVANLHRDITNHNQTAPDTIRKTIAQKRAKAESVVNAVTKLGIPAKQRGEPLTFTVPTKRRESPVHRPAVPAEKYEPEPVLDEKEYEHILGVLRSMSLVIERNPDAFASLDEEAIRTHFLLQLNGHYEGTATGETFNASGKTDILIRVENRNVFIAECKFWRGQKSFSAAVGQLLGYLSWRDSKCALLIFNPTRDSLAVRQKMHEIMESHLEFTKTVSHDPNGDSRYVFVKASDPGREIMIATMLFDIPQRQRAPEG